MNRISLRQVARWSVLAGVLLGSADAAGIKLRPQGDALVQAVQATIAQLATKDVPMTLDPSSGPTMTVGGVGVSAAPFNPDTLSRVVVVGGERRIEINPQAPVPLAEAVKQALMAELKLKEWTPSAAQQRFGGADLNGDGSIDLADLALLMANFGTNTGAAGDLNQDRKVDDADLRIFSAQYSKATAQPVKAPAPAAAPASPPAPGTAAPPVSPGTTPAGTDATKPPPAPTTPDQPATDDKTADDKTAPAPAPPTTPTPPSKP